MISFSSLQLFNFDRALASHQNSDRLLSDKGEGENFTRLLFGCIEADFATKYSFESNRRDLSRDRSTHSSLPRACLELTAVKIMFIKGEHKPGCPGGREHASEILRVPRERLLHRAFRSLELRGEEFVSNFSTFAKRAHGDARIDNTKNQLGQATRQ